MMETWIPNSDMGTLLFRVKGLCLPPSGMQHCLFPFRLEPGEDIAGQAIGQILLNGWISAKR
jgi:hypothetical protein